MAATNQLLYNIALTLLPEVGSVLAKNLIAYCGSAEAVFKANQTKLKKIPLVGEVRAAAIEEAVKEGKLLRQAEDEIKFIEKHNIQAIFFTESNYPHRLKECDDGPPMLYYKGNADLNAQKVVAVVGTRNATEYGKEVTKKLVKDLAAQNVLVMSGLAYGIDIYAHNAALDNNLQTIGVLAHGLNRLYPAQHRNTAKRMVEQGGLLTEYTSQCDFTPHNFPQRNRIVSGMSDAVIVVESDVKGGALITANIANSYNREVFAVPGKTTDRFSRGCNFLIKTYKAQIIDSAADMIEAMNWQSETAVSKTKVRQLTLPLAPSEQAIFDVLKEGESGIDILLAKCNLNSGELSATLLEMEMNGVIVSLPGKRYKLTV
jgi:DNA processing protein